jgi:hypothetical protein
LRRTFAVSSVSAFPAFASASTLLASSSFAATVVDHQAPVPGANDLPYEQVDWLGIRTLPARISGRARYGLLSGLTVSVLLVIQPSEANRTRCRLGGLVVTAIFFVLRVARTLYQRERSDHNFAPNRHAVRPDGQSPPMKVIKIIVFFPEYQVLTLGELNINVSSIVI